MRARTEELLYLALWCCDMLTRPTYRNLTGSFEAWGYVNGLHRQLAELERRKLLERKSPAPDARRLEKRLRLTEEGRLHALGGRDPEKRWSRNWDGLWRAVLFDFPNSDNQARDRLRRQLILSGFGFLQNSVWISPDPLPGKEGIFQLRRADVGALITLEARPCSGERNDDIVRAAWDFDAINERYDKCAALLKEQVSGRRGGSNGGHALRQWAAEERKAWLAAVKRDPLLPETLLPRNYRGRKTWELRLKVMKVVGQQLRATGKRDAATVGP